MKFFNYILKRFSYDALRNIFKQDSKIGVLILALLLAFMIFFGSSVANAQTSNLTLNDCSPRLINYPENFATLIKDKLQSDGFSENLEYTKIAIWQTHNFGASETYIGASQGTTANITYWQDNSPSTNTYSPYTYYMRYSSSESSKLAIYRFRPPNIFFREVNGLNLAISPTNQNSPTICLAVNKNINSLSARSSIGISTTFPMQQSTNLGFNEPPINNSSNPSSSNAITKEELTEILAMFLGIAAGGSIIYLLIKFFNFRVRL